MASDLGVIVKLRADASQYTAEFGQAKQLAQSLAATLRASGGQAAAGLATATTAAQGLATATAASAQQASSGLAQAGATAQSTGAAFKATGTQANEAAAGLEGLAKSSRETSQSQQQSRTAGESFIAMLRDQVAVASKSTEELLRYRAAQAGVATEAAPLILQLQNQKAAQLAAAQAAREEEAAQRSAAAAQQQRTNDQAHFLDGLREQIALQGKSSTEALQYRAAQLGVSAEAANSIRLIDEANKKGTISAGQHAQAMRMLPAQMTDVVTSVASGMPIWMVAIQQGGQIKDSFGGAGNALKAMASAVTPAVAVLGTLAVAGGAVAAAYYQGSSEGSTFRRELLMSGNAAGTSVSQLTDMARAVGELTTTQGAATQALAQMAGTGAVAADNLQGFAETAINLERYIGQPVKTTVGHLEELGKKPLEASVKLNEQYRYLTDAVYLQIKALQDQGKMDEAASLAQKTYSQAMGERADEMRSQMGSLERVWDSLGRTAARAWDAMLNVGRAASLSDIRAKIDATNAELNKLLVGDDFGATGGGAATGDGGRGRVAALARLRKELGELEAAAAPLEAQEFEARTKAEKQAADQAVVEARTRVEAQRKAVRTRAEIRQDEIKQLDRDRETLKMSADEYGKLLANIEQKHKDPKGSKGSTAGQVSITDTQIAGLKSQLQAAQQYHQQLLTLGASASELNAGERESLKLAEQIKLATNAKTKAKLEQAKVEADALGVQLRTNDGLDKSYKSHQQSIDANYKDAQAITQRAREQAAANEVFGKGRTAIEQMTLATLQHQLTEAEQRDNYDPAYVASLREKIAAQKEWVIALGQADYKAVIAHADELLRNANELSRAYDDELALSGLTGLEREKIVAQRQVELKYAKEVAAMDNSSLTDSEKRRAKEKVYEAQRIEASAAGAKAQQTYMGKASDEINRNLTDALMRGFENGKGPAENLADSVENMFSTMVLRPTLSAVMTPVSLAINGVVQQGLNAIGLGGSGNNLLSTASNASSLYSLATGNSVLGQGANWLGLGSAAATAGAATGIAAGVGSGLTLASTSAGLGLTGAAGTGFSLAAGGGLGLTAGSAGAGAIGAGLGSGAAAAGGTAAAGAGGLTGALAAIPGWGWALGGLAALGLSGTFNSRGANHSGGAYSTASADRNTAASQALATDAWGNALSDITQRGNTEIDKKVGETVNALSEVYKSLSQFATGAREIDIAAAFAVNGKHGDEDRYGYYSIIDKVSGEAFASYKNRALGNDDAAAYTKFATDLANGVFSQLRSSGLEKWVDDTLAKLGDAPSLEALATAVAQITAAQAALTQFGLAMPQFAAQSEAARASLMGAAGGSEVFTAQLSSFYGNYFTEAERTAVATQQVTAELEKLGYAMPASRDEYRQWVTAAIDAGESGVKSAAGLLKLESAVAGLTQTSDAVAKAAVQAQQEASKAAASLRSNLIGLESKFSGGGQSRAYQVEDAAASVSALFASVGIDKGVGELAAKIQSATSADVEQYFREMWSMLPTTEARQQLVDVTTAMLGMTSAAGSLAEAATSSTRSFSEAASAALSARTSAGGLLDRINGELGGDGTAYALKREHELWAGLATASYAQQIDLAGQLTDSVLGRMQLEKESAEKLSSIHRGLRDSIEATRIGALSPLTLGQQLKEAGDQFNAAVEKARGGDTEAAGQVASLRQSYLALAQRYYAASDDYTAVFQASEDAVRGLAGQMQTDAERQLSASQSTVSELQRLRDVAQSAYQQADRDYVASSAAAQAQATLLASMDGGISSLGEILQGLPAELAAQLQPLLGAGSTDAALIATMRAAQDARPELMLSGLQQQALAGGASAAQVARVSSKLYSDVDVAALLQAGRANYPTWSMEQLAALGQSQYGIGREQLDRVIDGSHANGLDRVPFDDYVARLHKDELVMPARQAEIFRSLDFSQFGRGFEAIVQQLQSVQAELSQARSENAQLMAMLAGVMESTGNSTGRQLRQAVREVALAGVKPR